MQVLQIGCGALGSMIAQATLAQGYALTIVRKSALAVPAGAPCLQMDVATGEGLSALRELQADILLYCLAPSSAVADAYQRIYYQGLRNVLAQLSTSALKHVFFVSSTRVYGQQQGEWIDDDTPAQPNDEGGRVLLAAEGLLANLPCGHTALRVSGIYGSERRYLIRMAQQPQHWPQQAQWTNRIHEQDVVGALMHAYQQVVSRQILPQHMILTDQQPTLQHEVLQWIAAQMDWPLPSTPPAMPQTGKRLRSHTLQQIGYQLKFADYQAGYAEILHSIKASAQQG